MRWMFLAIEAFANPVTFWRIFLAAAILAFAIGLKMFAEPRTEAESST